MSFCPKFDTFQKFIVALNNEVLIDRDKENTLRYDVLATTSKTIKNLFKKGISALPEENNSSFVIDKVDSALQRVEEGTKDPTYFTEEIINSKDNIQYSIALHEVMESIKGEADKARNVGVDVGTISADGVLPVLPMSRVAASIGRKIAYQQGYRFKTNDQDPKTAAQIETLYYAVGKRTLLMLRDLGYVNFHSNPNTIKDYLDSSEVNKNKIPAGGITTTKYQGLSLNEKKLDIKPNSQSADYFLNRNVADLTGTDLEVITNSLSAIRQITQPAEITLPDSKADKTAEDLRAEDDNNTKAAPTVDKARQKLYDNPLYLDTEIHSLMKAISKESQETGKRASEIIYDKFGEHPDLISALFGIKRSEDFSIDKKESIAGQNRSKTTPLDDLVDNFIAMEQDGDSPTELHMALKHGRNARLYYVNSVLNAHGSKTDRYMLTPGEYTVDSKGDDFKYLVYNIYEMLGDKTLTYDDILGKTKRLDTVLKNYDKYTKAEGAQAKLGLLSRLTAEFPGTDYVTLVTSLKAINDVRNPVDGKVTTEFAVSADATASGGTLTFMQALGTNPNIRKFLQRIGILKGGNPDEKIDDLYGIMSEAIDAFVNNKDIPAFDTMVMGPNTEARRKLLGSTVALLFGTSKNDLRELSKDPTMTFVYGQGKTGAIESMSRSLADRILNNFDKPETQDFLTKLFGNKDYKNKSDIGLYKDVVQQLKTQGIPGQLWDIMDAAVNDQYLKEYKLRSGKIADLVQALPANVKSRFKILPAAMYAEGKNPSLSTIKEYGMPLTKVIEVSNVAEGVGDNDTVLTREQKFTATVANVSPIHSIDAAQLYGSILKVLKKNGMVVVHDDARGTVQDVRALEAEYLNQTKDILSNYDIHEQIMLSIAAYDPDTANSKAYKKLMSEIQESIETKKEMLSDMNMETHALIGHGTKYKDFANASESEQQSTPEARQGRKEQSSPSPSAMDKLVELAGESEIIQSFILMANSSNLEFGKNNKFKTRSDTVKITKKATKEQIEHEITHANTVAYIAKAFEDTGSQANREVRYFKKAIDQVVRSNTELSEDAQARMDYIKSQGNDVDQVAEFVAVMSSESETATEIYKVLSKNSPSSIRERIAAFVKKVVDTFVKVSDEDFQKEIDIEKLYTALESTVANGRAQRETNYQEASKYLKGVRKSYGYGAEKAYSGIRGKVDYANATIARMITSRAERKGAQILPQFSQWLEEKSPIYHDVIQKISGIYDSSEQLQQLIHTITGEGVDKTKKADVLAQFARVMGQQTEVINQQMGKFHKALKPLSKEERAVVGRFVMETPLHDYFLVENQPRTAKEIDEEVKRLTAELQRRNDDRAIKVVNDLVSTNVNDTPKGKFYNLEGAGYKGDSGNTKEVRALLALKSIQEIGAKKFENFLKNEELSDLIMDEVMANKLSLDKVDGTKYLNDSLIQEEYKEPLVIEAVNEHEFRKYEDGENTGWKILRRPEKGALGIVYKNIIDSTNIPGAYTDTKLRSGDINVYGKAAETEGVVEVDGIYKLRLTRQERIDLGMVEDFSQSLVRSTAHNMAVQESQIIRDKLLKKDTRMKVGKDATALVDKIDAANVDNPWFVKLEEGVTYDQLPAKVKAKYKKVGSRASNVENFNEEVDLVRKDIAHWLLGGSAKSLFTNPKYKWAMRVVKDLVAGAKIGMVVLNPVKIANDNISNVSYLSVMGVDPVFITKNYKNIMRDYGEYSDLQRQIISLKVRLAARPENEAIKKKIRNLQKRIKKNPLGDLSKKGFINSLGSDLVSKNADTLSGLQADMHSALEYLLLKKDGTKNPVGHFLTELQNLGFNGEDFLRYIGTLAKRAKGENVQKELDQVADRLKEIRTEGDVINYVSQYTNSPGSEAVRMGSAATDLTDVLAKETLYRHLRENTGATEEQARIQVLDSFPDYKENMPLAVRQLSDTGIIMFPSFWLRIQKAIYRMARDKPLNLSTELMLEEALGTNVNTILDANIINKHNSFGGLFHTPFESMGIGSVVPTHIF